MTNTKERPILFSTPMVQAILEGRKTQTRRVLKLDKSGYYKHEVSPSVLSEQNSVAQGFCPHGKVGDRLWVKESYAAQKIFNNLKPSEIPQGTLIGYKAGYGANVYGKNRPSIFMPRWASRITLEITNIRVERLQDISQGDAQEEGCEGQIDNGLITPVEVYEKLWESINGKGSWDKNPWVWVVEFKRV